jgi:hypothetical protein
MTSKRPVAWSLRLFRALASAYPHEFRNIYGDEMLQMAEDVAEPVWRRHGVRGLLRLLADVALRIPVEYAAEFRQDVRYAARMLRASPGFTAVALLSLTLGIGVATSAFSEMNGFILRDVPAVARPAELVALKGSVSYEGFRRYAAHDDLFAASMAYLAPVAFGVSFVGRSERAWGNVVTGSYFHTLGVRPLAGRFFSVDDRAAVVLSHRLWKDRLGGDTSVIGKSLRLNGHPCEIVGVAPEDFRGASPMVYGADPGSPSPSPRPSLPSSPATSSSAATASRSISSPACARASRLPARKPFSTRSPAGWKKRRTFPTATGPAAASCWPRAASSSPSRRRTSCPWRRSSSFWAG